MNKDDVEQIVSSIIKERKLVSLDELLQGLSIHVKNGGFTDPNSRTVSLLFNGEEISSTWFDVVQMDEYCG